MESSWGHFEHGADVGVRGLAAGMAGAFEQAALALVALVSDPAGVRPLQAVPIVCNTPDDELLLLDWLNAVVSEVAVRRMLFSAFTVTMSDGRLEAVARGEPISPDAVRNDFLAAQRLVHTLYNALKPDRAAAEFTGIEALLVLNWRAKAASRAQLKLAIEDALDLGLPRAYTPELYQQKCNAIFEHFYVSYPEREQSIDAELE